MKFEKPIIDIFMFDSEDVSAAEVSVVNPTNLQQAVNAANDKMQAESNAQKAVVVMEFNN